MPVNQKAAEIPALTGVRFLATAMVFLCHYSFLKQQTGVAAFFAGIFKEMYIGVTLFFVLSGFLICYNYYDSIRLDRGFLKGFFVKRFARIYPLYFLLATLHYLYHWSTGKAVYTEYFFNITLLKGFFKNYLYTGIQPAWSLTTEETFYFLAPIIFYAIRRNLFVLAMLVLYLTGILLVLVFSEISWYGFFNDFKFMFWITFFGKCFEFFVGIQLALMVKREISVQHQVTKPRTRYTIGGVLFIFVCLVLLYLNALYYELPRGSRNWYGISINNFILPIGVAIFFYGLITEATTLRKILSSALFRVLGKSSYAFYLIHLGLFSNFILHKVTKNVFLLYLIVQFAAIILFYIVERPANRLIRRRFLRTVTQSSDVT
jgi:peptidoglycan/LPS O-acetylase OafA/YrhL